MLFLQIQTQKQMEIALDIYFKINYTPAANFAKLTEIS